MAIQAVRTENLVITMVIPVADPWQNPAVALEIPEKESAMLEVNEYFDGKVKSIAFQTATLPATVGVMAPGNYEFDTSKKEVVTVVSGLMTVKLPGEDTWQDFQPGDSFTVAAGQVFHLQIAVDSAYLCTYE